MCTTISISSPGLYFGKRCSLTQSSFPNTRLHHGLCTGS
jgi:hypothetical protein